ncbi:MAG: phosphoglycerate dehydrogenase, partial [Deltaproteobacteria bacterium]|nr:phosphoglycerate dehydrogenase [Deltaproteobacteria bacterium]
ELLEVADIVTLHVDGRQSNRNLMGEEEFQLMKKGSIFLNLSRGHIVDVAALAQHIKNGRLAGAAVDVYPYEPLSNKEEFISELRGLPNVILTPHIGGSTLEAQRNIGEYVAARMIEYINNGSSFSSVNFPNIQLPLLQRAHRFLHVHKNVPGILAEINRILADGKINILGQYLKTSDQIGYVITDVNKKYNSKIVDELRNVRDTIKFRVLY